MKTVRIAGVPEHFNYPIHLANQEGAFETAGVQLQWIDVPEGTGRMAGMVANEQTDMALMLTEGTLRAAGKGVPLRIVQTYVQSPLLWGIHTGRLGKKSANSLADGRFAISRFGSGSHLMAKVMGLKNGIQLRDEQFVVVNHLQGALAHLEREPNTYFLWERFTTNPYVKEGLLDYHGDFPTPWPCFVWVASERFAQEEKSLIASIQRIVNRYTSEFLTIPSIDRTLANAYALPLDQVRQWMGQTQWSQESFTTSQWNEVQSILLELGVLKKKLNSAQFLL
jgi:hypothetical protein